MAKKEEKNSPSLGLILVSMATGGLLFWESSQEAGSGFAIISTQNFLPAIGTAFIYVVLVGLALVTLACWFKNIRMRP